MPPLPHAYQGRDAIGAFLRGADERRGAPMRMVPTRANGQPAFACAIGTPARRRTLGLCRARVANLDALDRRDVAATAFVARHHQARHALLVAHRLVVL